MKKLYFIILFVSFLNFSYAQIVDFKGNNTLKGILLSGINDRTNQYVAKDLNGNPFLIDSNNDREIQISEALKVKELNLSNLNSPFSYLDSLEGIESFTNLSVLNISYHSVKNIDISSLLNLTSFNCYSNNGNKLNVSGLNKLKVLYAQNNSFVSLDLTSLTDLESLNLNSNYDLLTLDVTKNLKLKNLSCSYSHSLYKIDIEGLNNLETFTLDYSNEIKKISFKKLKSLKTIYCNGNATLSELVFDGLDSLEELYCSDNAIRGLDFLETPNLKKIDCSYNELTTETFKITNLLKLTDLECSYNNLTSLDVSNLINLKKLRLGRNLELTSLFIKNGNDWCSTYCDSGINLGFTGCKKLKYICAEDRLNSQIQMIIYQNGISSKIEVNSYCSFVSPKDAYVIKGNSIFDNDNNGCDNDDYKFTNLDYSIINLSDVTNATTKYSGNFTIPVANGSYQIKANIENPDFFEIFPSIGNVNFPADTSPFTQNFCISPLGNHSDLEITILPINIARPGFDAAYKIVFKNKGNQIQSGKVNLEYYSNVLNYQSSNVAFSEKNNNTLSWLFENLKPFESREITVTLKVNSPTHSPAVQQGDLLEFTASILSDKIDEKPNDNSFLFRQTALNSYDPNDKTCLEGSVITPDLIGEYVHYMIRFENTGNYMAQNIVVKDMIDLNKFDISTLIPTSSSHSFVTKISEGNKVEFIFENIKLPFDDSNNDGYIAFKIKTKPTLKVGDSFTNDANIYFDYNFPILTNEATSIFKTTLSISDFDFSKYFILYPNPSDQVLNISKTQDIEIKSFEIYDILGQLIIAVPDAKTISNIDVSRLEKGNYFIKVKSDRGNSSMKFIKI
ncbi:MULTISPECIES: leucine-rich repeat domain-containing protein [Flavobacterium]|uniref:DUF7619 domain-containing protein n=1 Tax=Flavobacterium TaxID=237 RepID=UPI001183D534|nr:MULTISPECIES: leucine-rich repeat domain-containing protein [Flavobacterium]MCR4029228.1 leucine-rich repeat domain-containing protein [Flavobacterium panacis]